MQAAGSLLGVGLMIRAYQIADAGRVSVLEYVILPASAFWSWVIWDETLSWQAWVGMALIVAAGSMIALRAQAQAVLPRGPAGDRSSAVSRRRPRANAGGTGFDRSHCRRSPPARRRAARAPSGPLRTTMVAFLPQWQIVRTSRISSAQARRAADPGKRLP